MKAPAARILVKMCIFAAIMSFSVDVDSPIPTRLTIEDAGRWRQNKKIMVGRLETDGVSTPGLP
jgi:hypothetical protein